MKRHARGVFVVLALAATLAVSSLSVRPCAAAETDGQGIQWRKSYYAAAEEAARTRKPMLMQVTATWCGACQSMFAQTFADDTVVEQVNSSFVPFKLDADRHADLIATLGVKALPTTIVIDSDLTILSRMAGFRASGSFGDALGAAARRSADRNRTTARAGSSAETGTVALEQAEFPAGGFVAAVLRIVHRR